MQGNPFGKYNGNELDYVSSFLHHPKDHDWVKLLEASFATKIDNKYAIAVNSGTSALHAALVACDVKGGEVLMPALCPAMVAFAVIHAGATPVFCDVDPETHHISKEEIEKKYTNKCKAILAVSLHGLPVDWNIVGEKWLELDASRPYYIDDCAQALGAKGIGKADITCFSFEDKKHITTGSEGGMITTNNADLAMRARKFAGLGYKHMTAEAGRTSLAKAEYQNPDYERFDTIGLNYRMSQIQAAVGLAQLERLDHKVAMRKACGELLFDVFGEHGGKFPVPMFNKRSSLYTFVVEYNGDMPWQRFHRRFTDAGGNGFYAMPQVPYREPALYPPVIVQLSTNPCPIAEDLQKKLMLFKTNYRDLGQAERQAEILAKLIGEL
jgi:perosamine synthetase